MLRRSEITNRWAFNHVLYDGFIATIIVLLVSISSPMSATGFDVSSWVLPSDQLGNWSVDSYWDNGVPTSNMGALIDNGGTAIITSDAFCESLQLGSSTGSGLLKVTCGSLSVTNGFAYIGYSGTGIVEQFDGTFSAPDGWGLWIGILPDSIGTYNLTNGFVSGACELLGEYGEAHFIQSGGIHSATGLFMMAGNVGGYSTYNLEGTGVFSSSVEYIGASGTAHFIQSGGVNTTDSMILGESLNSVGIYDLNDGQLSVTQFGIKIGYSGTGIFTQSGGTNTIYSGIFLGMNSSGSGTYNLNGGTLLTDMISAGDGTSIFNIGGGILKAIRAFSTKMPMTLTHIGVDSKFDTTNGHIILSGILSGPGGLNKLGLNVLNLSGSNIYTGNTTVSAGTLKLSKTGSLFLTIDDGMNNRISVNSGAKLDLFGTIKLDIGDVLASSENWTLISNSGITIYESSFALTTTDGTTFEQDNDIWSYKVGSQHWTFSEATGVLSLTTVPEPSAIALLIIGFMCLLGCNQWRRKQRE
jgi:autotransporter-associated beta strand protein